MTGLYIFGGLIVAGIVAIIVFKTRANIAAKAIARRRVENIENERVEELAKAEARAKN